MTSHCLGLLWEVCRWPSLHQLTASSPTVFIYSMPGYKCSIKERMLYSSCKSRLLDSVEQDFQLEIAKKVQPVPRVPLPHSPCGALESYIHAKTHCRNIGWVESPRSRIAQGTHKPKPWPPCHLPFLGLVGRGLGESDSCQQGNRPCVVDPVVA